MYERDYVSETTMLPTAQGAPPLVIITNRPLPLRWKILRDYAESHRLADDRFPMFYQLIRALDNEYLAIQAEQQNNRSPTDEEK